MILSICSALLFTLSPLIAWFFCYFDFRRVHANRLRFEKNMSIVFFSIVIPTELSLIAWCLIHDCSNSVYTNGQWVALSVVLFIVRSIIMDISMRKYFYKLFGRQ